MIRSSHIFPGVLALFFVCLGGSAWGESSTAAGSTVSAGPAETEVPSASPALSSGGGESGHYGRTPAKLVPYGKGRAPYRRFFLEPPPYRGEGRSAAEPGELSTVRIGLLAPLEGTRLDHLGKSVLQGVELALEEANQAGGFQGHPFELVVKNDRLLWGGSGNILVDLAYGEHVWALISSINSNSTHVALRAALKAEIPMVDVWSTDPTITETGIPWILRSTPDHRQTSYRLAQLLFQNRGLSRVAVLRSSNRYGRLGVGEFRDAAQRLSKPLVMEAQFTPGADDFSAQLRRIAASKPEAVVLWADAEDAARIVRQMREKGMDQLVVGSNRIVSPRFLDLAGKSAEGVMATFPMNLDSGGEDWKKFVEKFRQKTGGPPDAFAAYSYDAANLLMEAIRKAGLNRARIRDELASLQKWRGVTGEFVFDATSNNVAPLFLAHVKNGRFVFE